MPDIQVPTFFDQPEGAWVKCEESRELAGNEVACTMLGVNKTRVVITTVNHYDAVRNRLRGVVVGKVGGTDRLVDFPSGDRILMPQNKIEA